MIAAGYANYQVSLRHPSFATRAARTDESLRPTQLVKVSAASVFCRKACLELCQRPGIIFHGFVHYILYSLESSKYPLLSIVAPVHPRARHSPILEGQLNRQEPIKSSMSLIRQFDSRLENAVCRNGAGSNGLHQIAAYGAACLNVGPYRLFRRSQASKQRSRRYSLHPFASTLWELVLPGGSQYGACRPMTAQGRPAPQVHIAVYTSAIQTPQGSRLAPCICCADRHR